MAYVVGTCIFTDGKLVGINDLKQLEGERPSGPGGIPKCDPEVLRAMEGTTRARLGAGFAIVLNDITRLAWSSDRVMGRLRNKVPQLFDDSGQLIARQGLLGLWRDGEAGGTNWCADACAGVVETTAIYAAAVKEAVEIGFYSADGYIGVVQDSVYDLNGELETNDGIREDEANPILLQETYSAWRKLLGVAPASDRMLHLKGRMERCISRNGDIDRHHFYISTSTEPQSGSVEVIYRAFLDLPEISGGWRLRDTELMGDPLNRRPTLIVPIEGQAPVLLQFCRYGHGEGFDPHGTLAWLEGSNLDMQINGKVRAVLNDLGWLP